ncbi:MAG: hypothetical protein GKR88_18540 [Flavobacteriaceae bacterium]|nr:MAG: hypothetical protein GKR88_18540 [Flavobacteriaceae bacterium]
MASDKLTLIKKIIEQQLDSFDFNKEIDRNEKMLSDLRETPADEYSLSGNIEYGIINLLSSATGVTHPIGYLTAKKGALKEFLDLLDKDTHQLEEILNPVPQEKDSSWKDDFLERLETKDKSEKKHFFDCTLTDEDWGSENCICPGAYIYRKYLSIGLSEEEAKLISDYRELDDLMEDKEKFAKGKTLYEKHKFLNVSNQR